MQGDFDFPTRVLFGSGRLRELPAQAAAFGSRPLVVTDPGVLASGVVERLRERLRAAGATPTLFAGVRPDPDLHTVLNAADAYREAGCDYLIAIGGGSPIDAAKAVRVDVSHDESFERFLRPEGDPSQAEVRVPLPPLVAIPTTAGTGSEVGRSTVVTRGDRKRVLFHPTLIPTLAVCDPELTVGMPAAVTAGTGADALIHNLEAFFARGYHPVCDGIALEGLRSGFAALPRAVESPSDLTARSDMMAAALMGAIAFQKGLGVIHSLAHPLSTVARVHHGTANAVMLPHALRFNAGAIAARAGRVAEAIGLDARGEAPAETVERLAEAFSGLFARIGLPRRLGEVGVVPELVERLADLAYRDGCHLCNPRDVTQADLAALYRAAL